MVRHITHAQFLYIFYLKNMLCILSEQVGLNNWDICVSRVEEIRKDHVGIKESCRTSLNKGEKAPLPHIFFLKCSRNTVVSLCECNLYQSSEECGPDLGGMAFSALPLFSPNNSLIWWRWLKSDLCTGLGTLRCPPGSDLWPLKSSLYLSKVSWFS